MLHLQCNGKPYMTACGEQRKARTWNLCDVTCPTCKKSEQYTDSEHFGDIGSTGREIPYGAKNDGE